jgi:hypothetical protein
MPMLIHPYESFARDIFGVLEMPQLLAIAEQNRISFAMARDYCFEHKLDPRVREELRRLARALSQRAEQN